MCAPVLVWLVLVVVFYGPEFSQGGSCWKIRFCLEVSEDNALSKRGESWEAKTSGISFFLLKQVNEFNYVFLEFFDTRIHIMGQISWETHAKHEAFLLNHSGKGTQLQDHYDLSIESRHNARKYFIPGTVYGTKALLPEHKVVFQKMINEYTTYDGVH